MKNNLFVPWGEGGYLLENMVYEQKEIFKTFIELVRKELD